MSTNQTPSNSESLGCGCLALCLLAAAPWVLIVAFVMLAVIL